MNIKYHINHRGLCSTTCTLRNMRVGSIACGRCQYSIKPKNELYNDRQIIICNNSKAYANQPL